MGGHATTAKTISLTTPDGAMPVHAVYPASGAWPAAIMFMDGMGIRPAMHAMAARLASHGYHVLLPDLYYRAGAYQPVDMRTVFASPDNPERTRVRALMSTVSNEGAARDIGALIAGLARAPGLRGDAIGCVGYCMGGRMALLAAGTFPARIAAASSIHGGGLATDKPDSPHLLAPHVRAEVYLGAAGIDPHVPQAELDRVTEALRAAGVTYTLEVHPGVQHGFGVDESPVYDRDAAERCWSQTLALFARALA